MAQLYLTFNVPDIALLTYDALELSYLASSEKPPAVWFKTFGGQGIGDDAADPLNLLRKPYRDLILSSDISVWDFRSYLFGRQCQLLFQLNKPDLVCGRTKWFVTVLGRGVEEHRVSTLTNSISRSSPAFCV